MLNSKRGSFKNYLMANGWFVFLVIIIALALYIFGVVNYSLRSLENCEIGDGIECLSYIARTNNTRQVSQGTSYDAIEFILNNQLEHPIYNLSIIIPECQPSIRELIFLNPNEPKEYIITGCSGLKPGGKFKSIFEVRYTLIANDTKYSIRDFGYIRVFVESPKPESVFYNIRIQVQDALNNMLRRVG